MPKPRNKKAIQIYDEGYLDGFKDAFRKMKKSMRVIEIGEPEDDNA